MTRILFERATIEFYTGKIERREHFAFVGYSDAEWYCITGFDEGKVTGYGQTITSSVSTSLMGIVRKRLKDEQFMIASPDCIWEGPMFDGSGLRERIDKALQRHGVDEIVLYERDSVLDEAAEHGILFPWIRCFRSKLITFVGNAAHRDISSVIGYTNFVEIPPRNLHLDGAAMKDVICQIRSSPPTQVYLFAAGIASAMLIDAVYDYFPSSCFVDCGSAFDAFVGIGSQREWRRQLYLHPERLIEWRKINTGGANNG